METKLQFRVIHQTRRLAACAVLRWRQSNDGFGVCGVRASVQAAGRQSERATRLTSWRFADAAQLQSPSLLAICCAGVQLPPANLEALESSATNEAPQG